MPWEISTMRSGLARVDLSKTSHSERRRVGTVSDLYLAEPARFQRGQQALRQRFVGLRRIGGCGIGFFKHGALLGVVLAWCSLIVSLDPPPGMSRSAPRFIPTDRGAFSLARRFANSIQTVSEGVPLHFACCLTSAALSAARNRN
jgi:hypothetical protein